LAHIGTEQQEGAAGERAKANTPCSWDLSDLSFSSSVSRNSKILPGIHLTLAREAKDTWKLRLKQGLNSKVSNLYWEYTSRVALILNYLL